jgi:hypothetical protein
MELSGGRCGAPFSFELLASSHSPLKSDEELRKIEVPGGHVQNSHTYPPYKSIRVVKTSKMTEIQLPKDVLESVVFRVSAGEDGDAFAAAGVMIDGKEWKIFVDHVEDWDDGSDDSCSSAFFKRKVLAREMVFIEGKRPRTLIGFKRSE